MENTHPYRLRPYHNPEKADESKAPDGWRLLYADEAGRPQRKLCCAWLTIGEFDDYDRYSGDCDFTYIVPVA